MRKLTKRIAAMGAAVMIMASMSVMGAGAAYSNSFKLHYASGGEQVMSATYYHKPVSSGKYSIKTNVTSISSGTLTGYGYVQIGGTYYLFAKTTQTTTGTKSNSSSDNRISSNYTSRNVAKLTVNSGSKSASSNGTISNY